MGHEDTTPPDLDHPGKRARMTKPIILLLLTYSALKSISIAHAKSAGYRRAEVSLGARIRVGEPTVFLVALMIAVPVSLGTSWYSHRAYKRTFESSSGCYGRIMALKDLPAIKNGTDSFAIYENIQGYKGSAKATATNLGMTPAETDRWLDNQVRASARRYSSAAGGHVQQRRQEEIAETWQCLHPPPDPANA